MLDVYTIFRLPVSAVVYKMLAFRERGAYPGLMHRVVIFGNSGSGKSTLAREMADRHSCSLLDLDVLAWEKSDPLLQQPRRRPLADSLAAIDAFLRENESWVIEGVYSDLLGHALRFASRLIFLNPGVETCAANARNRPWEPHKYPSREAQDKNLEMLIRWIEKYPEREDEFSLGSHRALYEGFAGEKIELTSNDRSGL